MFALLSQLVEETVLEAVKSQFESEGGHQVYASVAQLVEQRTFNPLVASSSLARPTITKWYVLTTSFTVRTEHMLYTFLPLIRQVRLASRLIYWAIAHLNSLYYNVHNYVQNNGEKMNTLTPIHARTTISVTDLRKLTPSKIIEQAGGNPVAILSHNKPEAYLLSAKVYETILDALDDLELIKTVEKRRGGKTIRVNLEDL